MAANGRAACRVNSGYLEANAASKRATSGGAQDRRRLAQGTGQRGAEPNTNLQKRGRRPRPLAAVEPECQGRQQAGRGREDETPGRPCRPRQRGVLEDVDRALRGGSQTEQFVV